MFVQCGSKMCQRKCFGVLILVSFVTLGQSAFSHGDLIWTFVVKHKQMSAVNLILCKNNHLVEMSKKLINSGVQVKSMRMQQIDVQRDLQDIFSCSLFRKIIVFDLDCPPYSEDVLHGLSNQTLFSQCNHWLFLENKRLVSLYVFEQLPISVNAEIILASREQQILQGNALEISLDTGAYWLYDMW